MEQANLAKRLVGLEQGLVQGLALLRSGRAQEAEALLAELVRGFQAPPPPASNITDDELELAFADAEPELEQMRDADDVAQEAMLEADRALEAEGALAPDDVGDHFATETMASLLERQGDESGAERIRAALVPADASPARSRRGEALATLERWLENLRGGARA